MSDGRLPVTVITGFLGSGKTTLLNHLLRDPAMADTAVVINEFGEVSLDHLLVEKAIENTLVLQGGCICCTIRGDLVDTLRDLMTKRDAGTIPAFARVAIETTGLADPTPIYQTLTSDPLVTPLFELTTIVTTVDAVNGSAQLDGFDEAVKQAALADVLLLTKADLATQAAIETLRGRLATLNPGAAILPVENGVVDADRLFAAAKRTDPATLKQWLAADAYAHHDHDHEQHGHGHHAHGDPNRHGADIRAFCIVMDAAISRPALEGWLASILSLRGADLLRVKGLVRVAGESGPLVIHGVQHLLHTPVQMPRWPDDDTRTRIVFITRAIPEAALRESFARSVTSTG